MRCLFCSKKASSAARLKVHCNAGVLGRALATNLAAGSLPCRGTVQLVGDPKRTGADTIPEEPGVRVRVRVKVGLATLPGMRSFERKLNQ